MNFKKLLYFFITFFIPINCEKFLITLNDENLNNTNILTDSKINYTDNFKIGNFSGYIIDTNYTLKELKNLFYINNVEKDNEINLDYQWGLDRIDQENLPLDKKQYNPINNGSDIYIYIIDTGIRISHVEFESRAIKGWNFIYNNQETNDFFGHGTHVASLATGKNVGTANKAVPVSVKVLDDNGLGTYSNIIKGIEWSVNHSKKNNKCGIISMSLSGIKNVIFNKVVNEAVSQGINVVVSAGNNDDDACLRSPASAEKAITVGSTTIMDFKSSFSNTGECVDIFAPGTSIFGAWNTGDNIYKTISGTSMAAPHVSGALAIYLKENGCDADINIFLNETIKNKISNIPSNTHNKLLNIKSIKTLTNSPTKNPSIECPSLKAISFCHRTVKSRVLRRKTSCMSKYYKKICSWCGRPNLCQPKYGCDKKYKNCPNIFTKKPSFNPTLSPTTNPTFNPTLSPSFNPTLSPTTNPIFEKKILTLKWLKQNKGISFELNKKIGKIKILNVNMRKSSKSSLYTWKNNKIFKESLIIMNIGNFEFQSGIPHVIIQNVENNITKFSIANIDGDNFIKNMDIMINFFII